MSKENKVLIYTAVLRPVLTYASPIWAYAAKSNFNIMDRCQNIILRQIAKARWLMRNEDIWHALNIPPPIKEFIKSISENCFNSLELIGNEAIKEIVLLHKVLLWLYGVNSPTRRIMENEGLFTNMQENT
ncbi:hypothetical protein AVEN_213057-1 [Araneus ventricosus]|uniref:RNA-directed DNA polymerase from mobile element jockey n=1 Tax=Araneus ventricosus TaxID=182803 RepID=A0A4Y2QPM1_ARAVE|nr:hypothetical protein AVEN_213057-1 [Araneus ventricosus]